MNIPPLDHIPIPSPPKATKDFEDMMELLNLEGEEFDQVWGSPPGVTLSVEEWNAQARADPLIVESSAPAKTGRGYRKAETVKEFYKYLSLPRKEIYTHCNPLGASPLVSYDYPSTLRSASRRLDVQTAMSLCDLLIINVADDRNCCR